MKMKLSPKPKIKTRLKTNLVYVAWTLGLASLVTGAVFLYLNLGSVDNVFAGGSSYSSTKTGTWTTNSTWTGGVAPGTTGITDNITFNTNHTVNSGTLDVGNNATFTINGSATLYITGDLVVNNSFTLNNYGTLIITGDMIVKNGAAITINGGGLVQIGGNASLGNNALLTVNGTLTIDGTLSFGSNPSFAGAGTVSTGSGCASWSGSGTCSTGSLPVKLLSFDALSDNGSVNLTWVTASEENNDFFTLERTVDGVNYNLVATIPGAGTTLKESTYTYQDASPLEGKSYYRLTQTDFDGKKEVFNNVSVNVEPSAASFKIYPNPLVGNTLKITIAKPEAGTIEVRDMKGNKITSKTIGSDDGNFEIGLNENLQPGFYYVSYKTASAIKIERFIKQ